MATIGNRNMASRYEGQQQQDELDPNMRAPRDFSSQYQYGPTQYGHGPGTPDYNFMLQTPEGRQAMRECSKESVWRRAIPLGILSMTAERYGTIAGYLKPSRWPIARTIATGFVAFIVGRASYVSACREKLDVLWNSPQFEEYRSQLPQQVMTPGSGQYPQPPPRQYADQSPVYDLDTTRNFTTQRELDDTFRPTMDNEGIVSHQQRSDSQGGGRGGGASHTSYAELRAQNRAAFEREQARSAVAEWSRREPAPQGEQQPRRSDTNTPPPSSHMPSNYNYTPP